MHGCSNLFAASTTAARPKNPFESHGRPVESRLVLSGGFTRDYGLVPSRGSLNEKPDAIQVLAD